MGSVSGVSGVSCAAGAKGQRLAGSKSFAMRDTDSGEFQPAELETDLGGGAHDDLSSWRELQHALDGFAEPPAGGLFVR